MGGVVHRESKECTALANGWTDANGRASSDPTTDVMTALTVWSPCNEKVLPNVQAPSSGENACYASCGEPRARPFPLRHGSHQVGVVAVEVRVLLKLDLRLLHVGVD
jgi:hypothetical protein